MLSYTISYCVEGLLNTNGLFCFEQIVDLFRYNSMFNKRFYPTNIYYLFRTNKLLVDCCDRHQLNQTSTLGGRSLVEMSTTLRHPQCRNFDQTSTKLWPDFDSPSVEVWSKFARYINGIHRKFEKMSTKLWHQTSTKLRHHIVQHSLFYLKQ